MKHVYALLAFLLIVNFGYAQDSTVSLSNYEVYCTSSGRLLNTRVFRIGVIREARVEVLKTTNIRSADTIAVMRITRDGYRNPPLISSYNLYFDKAQVDSLLNMIQLFNANIKERETLKQFDYVYVFSNDVQVSSTYDRDYLRVPEVVMGKLRKYVRTPVSHSPYWFGRNDLEDLLKLIRAAQELL